MDFVLFAKGIIAGFVIAAPVGPVGILCAQRTLAKGIPAGLIAGSGAAIADTIFGAVAAFGLTFIADLLLSIENWLRLGGGILLLVLGGLTVIKKLTPSEEPRRSLTRTAGDFAATFVLAITNPVTILSFSPVFLAVGAIVPQGDLPRAWTLILGVFAGSSLWWLTLCALASLFRQKLSLARMQIINRISGGLIVVFGVLVLASVTSLGKQLFNLVPI
jgi:threonine/homoserine/homoserine lactone efflux protein